MQKHNSAASVSLTSYFVNIQIHIAGITVWLLFYSILVVFAFRFSLVSCRVGPKAGLIKF
jgi:hypothetical protein